MAKVKSLVKLVLMSIVTAVRFTISQLEPFNRVTSIGGGLIGITSLPTEGLIRALHFARTSLLCHLARTFLPCHLDRTE